MGKNASSRRRSAGDLISHERLLSLVHYDPLTGAFTHLLSRNNGPCAVKRGQVAGKTNPKNLYRYISLDGAAYLGHRLAWFYMTGEWPTEEIDHKNRIRNDNRWENLREATEVQNKQNAIHPPGASGVTGARLRWDKKRWVSSIKVDGRSVHLGHFATAEEAGMAYAEAKQKLHPFAAGASA